VANSVTGVAVKTVLSNSAATVQATGETELAVGDNTITALVTAQDGVTTKTYTIVVKRLASSNANLSALTISDGTLTPAFSPSEIRYAASVPNSVTSLTVTPVVSDNNATAQVTGGANLVVGKNIIRVTVTAQNGTTKKTYVLTVTRAKSPTADVFGMKLDGLKTVWDWFGIR
jgi:hypothetical protein